MQRFKGEDLKIKRYGQVFSGKLVGDLLVAMLPDDLDAKKIIDPMVGQGDLLQAAHMKYPLAFLFMGFFFYKDVLE